MVGIVFFLRFPQTHTSFLSSSSTKQKLSQPTPLSVVTDESTAIFVPYWVVTGKKLAISEYDTVIYFGITATASGIDRTEEGYTKLATFNNGLPKGTTTLLTLRMLDPDTNFSILEKKDMQKNVIDETIALAEKYEFSGVVLDLELNALPFDSVLKNITSYNTAFAKAAHQQNLTFSTTLYGDTFYRFRPYNVADIAKNVDMIYIMAYDFHKSRGNPGPNFPYTGRDTYGYDFQKMVDDFLHVAPDEKVSVVFGMFGYDWKVDEKGKAQGNGISLSTYKVQQQFIDSCTQKHCEYTRDTQSGETKITYVTNTDEKHSIWFEDEKSVSTKKDYLKSKGISSVSYWAYSYY